MATGTVRWLMFAVNQCIVITSSEPEDMERNTGDYILIVIPEPHPYVRT
jgi:hypothetical protein